MKKLFTFLGAILVMAGSALRAQEVYSSAPLQTSASCEDATLEDGEDWIPEISLDSRFSYDRVIGGDLAGFGGDGFYLNIDGKISKHFSYSLCQKLFSQHGEDDSVFDNTDLAIFIAVFGKVVQKFVHKGEYAAVIGGGSKNKLAIAESIFNRFRHIIACSIMNCNFWTTFFF